MDNKSCFFFTCLLFLEKYSSVFHKMRVFFAIFLLALSFQLILSSSILPFFESDGSLWNQLMTGTTIIMYNAPWCKTCHKYLPQLETLKDECPADVKFLTMDCTFYTNTDRCLNNGVSSFPTFVMYINGTIQAPQYLGFQYNDMFVPLVKKKLIKN